MTLKNANIALVAGLAMAVTTGFAHSKTTCHKATAKAVKKHHAAKMMHVMHPVMMHHKRDSNASGWFAGVDAGMNSIDHVVDYSSTDRSEHHVAGEVGLAVGLQAGYHYQFEQAPMWYLGVVANGQYNNHKENVNGHVSNSSTTDTYSGSSEINWSYGVDLRLGREFRPGDFAYVGIGPHWGRYKYSYSRTDSSGAHSASGSHTFTGTSYVAGLMQHVSGGWWLAEQGRYTGYNSWTHQPHTGSTVTVKPYSITAMFSLIHRF